MTQPTGAHKYGGKQVLNVGFGQLGYIPITGGQYAIATSGSISMSATGPVYWYVNITSGGAAFTHNLVKGDYVLPSTGSSSWDTYLQVMSVPTASSILINNGSGVGAVTGNGLSTAVVAHTAGVGSYKNITHFGAIIVDMSSATFEAITNKPIVNLHNDHVVTNPGTSVGTNIPCSLAGSRKARSENTERVGNFHRVLCYSGHLLLMIGGVQRTS